MVVAGSAPNLLLYTHLGIRKCSQLLFSATYSPRLITVEQIYLGIFCFYDVLIISLFLYFAVLGESRTIDLYMCQACDATIFNSALILWF